MNDFWVEFTAETTFDQMQAGLRAVPAQNVTQEDLTFFFRARWGTSTRDLNNLRGRIETGSGQGSVEDIGLQGDEQSTKGGAPTDAE